MRASVLRGVRRLLLFIFGHLCVHTSSEHDPSDQGQPDSEVAAAVRWHFQVHLNTQANYPCIVLGATWVEHFPGLVWQHFIGEVVWDRGEVLQNHSRLQCEFAESVEQSCEEWFMVIHTSSQLAFFKAVFLFLLTTNANPLLELWLPCRMRLSRLLNPSPLPITIASLNEDNCLAVSLALFLGIFSLLYRGEFPSSKQEQGRERGPWGWCHTEPFLTQEPLQVLSYHVQVLGWQPTFLCTTLNPVLVKTEGNCGGAWKENRHLVSRTTCGSPLVVCGRKDLAKAS